MDKQRCKVCGRPDIVSFSVDDKTWNKVVPPQFQNRVVCLLCFDSFASVRGVQYVKSLKELFFVGDMASCELKIINRKEAIIN